MSFVVAAKHLDASQAIVEDEALTVSAFEHDGNGQDDADHWLIQALFQDKPEASSFASRIEQLAGRDMVIEPLEDQDWLAAVAEVIKPSRVGPFLVHAAKDRDMVEDGDLGIEIEAGLAFGSGEHPTTRACLSAILDIGPSISPANILDMGCGSAVLSIAAARYWRQCCCLGIEIDARAASVAAENATKNGLSGRIHVEAGDGYQAPLVQSCAPYDLVFANILADAVSAMAVDAAKVLKADGLLIVSGLLARQADDVTAAHQRAGLKLVGRTDEEGWSALTFAPSG